MFNYLVGDQEGNAATFERQGSETMGLITVKKALLEKAKIELAAAEEELRAIQLKTASTRAKLQHEAAAQHVDRVYPSALFVRPHNTPDTAAFDILTEPALYVHCLCEFRCDDDAGSHVPLWHPVGHAKSAATAELVAKLGPSIKAVYNNIRSTTTPRTVAGVAVPDLTAFIPQDASQLPGDDYDQHVGAPEGNALALAQSLFGEARDGKVGLLEKVAVALSGPFGAAGTELWVCAEHAALVWDWNEEEVGKKGAIKRAAKLIGEWSLDSVC